MRLRVQSAAGLSDLDLPDGSSFADLKSTLASLLAIPVAAQELCTGFPPRPIVAADADLVSFALESGTRLIVKSSQGAEPLASTGSGRRKPTAVRRLQDGINPITGGALPAATETDQAALASTSSAAAPSGSQKRKCNAPSSGTSRGGGGDSSDGTGDDEGDADPLAHTLKSRNGSGKAASGGTRCKSIDKISSEYFNGSGSAIDAARGGKTTDFLSEHGMIEHRVTALSTKNFELTPLPTRGKGNGQLRAEFKAVKKQVSECVQRLSRDELKALLRSLQSRGSRRRNDRFTHLLVPREMAARSAAVFWSFVYEFSGDIEGGIAALMGELIPEHH